MDIKFIFRVLIGIFLVFGVVLGGVFGGPTNAINVQSSASASNDIFAKNPILITFNTPFKNPEDNKEYKAFEIKNLEDRVLYKKWLDSNIVNVINIKENTLDSLNEKVKTEYINYDVSSKITQFQNDPSSLSTYELKAITNAGYLPTENTYKNYIEDIDRIERKETKTSEDNSKLSFAKDQVKSMSAENYIKTIGKITDQKLLEKLNDPNLDNNCEGFSMCQIGQLFRTKINAQSQAIKAVDDISKSLASCSSNPSCDYNTELTKRVTELKNGLNCQTSDTACKEKKKAIETLERQLEQKKEVQTNAVYEVISILTNPDKSALEASRLFGLDEKFNFKDSAIYEVFGEPIASNICLAKIDGYIDSQVSGANGGVTSYQFGTGDPDEELSERTLSVRYDLRAQMTRVTPDNKASISYSYFVTAPFETDLRLIIAVSYISDGKIRKEALTDLKSVKGGETSNGFESIELSLNGTNVDENSFQIGLVAVDSSKNPIYTITTPIILITSGTSNYNINTGSGNSQGNNNAQSNSNSFGVNDMLNLI